MKTIILIIATGLLFNACNSGTHSATVTDSTKVIQKSADTTHVVIDTTAVKK